MGELFGQLADLLLEGLIFLRDYLFFPRDGETFSLSRILSLFIAFAVSGGIAAFMSQSAVIKYFGPQAKKSLSYAFASVSGVILAVCSCSVLPMFASIRKKGAGLGPAIAFLFSGPAVNVLAITLTFNDIGVDVGFVRVISAVLLAIGIGLLMHAIFKKGEMTAPDDETFTREDEEKPLRGRYKIVFFTTLFALLISGLRHPILSGSLTILLVLQCVFFFSLADIRIWLKATFDLVRKIAPLFLVGVFIAGLLQALVSETVIVSLVGRNTYPANIAAASFGALMYFATMTEVPIVAGLMNLGMHKAAATALLLAGPSLSLPNMIVIGKVIGFRRCFAYVVLVVVFAAFAGYLAGLLIY